MNLQGCLSRAFEQNLSNSIAVVVNNQRNTDVRCSLVGPDCTVLRGRAGLGWVEETHSTTNDCSKSIVACNRSSVVGLPSNASLSVINFSHRSAELCVKQGCRQEDKHRIH